MLLSLIIFALNKHFYNFHCCCYCFWYSLLMCGNSHTCGNSHQPCISYVRQRRGNVSKRTFGHVRPAKIQISLRIRLVWSESSLGAFWKVMLSGQRKLVRLILLEMIIIGFLSVPLVELSWVLRPSQSIMVMSSRSIYLTTLFLGRLSPLSGQPALVHILSPETDNSYCPSWISGWERMTVGNISWSISTTEVAIGGLCPVILAIPGHILYCFQANQKVGKRSNKGITKTYLFNYDPLKPYFYIVKLGFTGVHTIFPYFCSKR